MHEPDRYFARRLIEDEQGRGWLDFRLAPGGAAEIVNIEVAWNHRRRGVGRRLLERLVAELPADVKVVYAFTSQVNAAAHRWYEAMGFELHPVPKLYFSMHEDAYCCVKVLALSGDDQKRTLNISAIVRSDCGGLGTLSRSFSDYLGFNRTVSISRHAGEHHSRWYANNRVADHGLTAELLDWLCRGADVLLSFETWYGDLAPRLARAMGVRTVLVPMYECCPPRGSGLEDTELAICPSLLDLHEMECHTPGLAAARRAFLPVPFDTARIGFRRRDRAEVFLHNMGHGGIGGRNGTRQVIEAWRHVRSDARLLIRHQSPLPIALPNDDRIRAVPRDRSSSGGDDYWDLWREGDVLLHPHRWDGLSLPIQEALCAGMPVMTTRYWPFCDATGVDVIEGSSPAEGTGWLPPSSQRMAIPATATTRQRICREITAYETTPQAIAATVDAWYGADLQQASEDSRACAERHSWERLLPAYRQLFSVL